MARFVVVGAGAVGGAVGARLAMTGSDVLLVARGEHGRAIAADGLRLDSPTGSERLRIPVVEALRPGMLGDDDVVLLATKSQDTRTALEQVVVAGGPDVPVVCMQNGIANERAALRRFSTVYGMVVVVPGTHLEPGVVVLSADDPCGTLHLGRYPDGGGAGGGAGGGDTTGSDRSDGDRSDGATDQLAGTIAAALRTAGFWSEVLDDVMAWKRAKLLMNLANALQALCGLEADTADLASAAREEARACFAAAGLAVTEAATFRQRAQPLGPAPANAAGRQGGSSWQSLARGLGSIETDYLNGEIVLLGRLHGVATPVNEVLQRVAGEQARAGSPPGSVPPAVLRAALGRA